MQANASAKSSSPLSSAAQARITIDGSVLRGERGGLSKEELNRSQLMTMSSSTCRKGLLSHDQGNNWVGRKEKPYIKLEQPGAVKEFTGFVNSNKELTVMK